MVSPLRLRLGQLKHYPFGIGVLRASASFKNKFFIQGITEAVNPVSWGYSEHDLDRKKPVLSLELQGEGLRKQGLCIHS